MRAGLFLLLALLLAGSGARAQPRRGARPAPGQQQGAPPAAAGFTASGLANEQTLTSLYRGDFESIRIEREDVLFQALFGAYLKTCAVRCRGTLPPDSVEMTRQVCVLERYPVNRYGGRAGPSTCAEYETQGTGLWADPRLYAAKTQLDLLAAGDAFGNVIRIMAQKDPVGATAGMVNTMETAAQDMDRLVQMNRCGGPALKRFEENLRRFALGKQPVRLAGGGGAAPPAPAGAPAAESDYTRLLEDLVVAQSKAWALNRYVGGSVSRVEVSERDAAGRPTKLSGRYVFEGLNGRSEGSVDVAFDDGVPECLYFFDRPSTCRTADRRIAAAYAAGRYRR